MIQDLQWLRIANAEDLDTILRPALAQVQFNNCSGLGHRDRQNRLLTLVGQRQDNRTAQLIGILFPDKPGLQAKAIDLISAVYAERTGGQALSVWLPRQREG